MKFNEELNKLSRMILASGEGVKRLNEIWKTDELEPCSECEDHNCELCKDSLHRISGTLLGVLTFTALSIKNPTAYCDLVDVVTALEEKYCLMETAKLLYDSLPKDVIETMLTKPIDPDKK